MKWKPPHENAIDFRLQLGDFTTMKDEDTGREYQDFDACPVLNLIVYHDGHKHEHFDELYVTPSKRESLKCMNRVLDGCIVECCKDEQGR